MTRTTLLLVLAACAAPVTATDTTAATEMCAAPPADVVVIDEHGLVARTCATIGERTQPEARIEVLRLDSTAISIFWTDGCELSPLVVAPIPNGHRFTAYPSNRDCVQAVGFGRSITVVTKAPLGTVEYLANN